MNKKLICLFLSLVLVMTFAMGVQAADDSVEYVQLNANADDLVISNDMLLDLNGHHVTNATVAAGVTLQLMDSANDEYDASKCGSFSGTVNGTIAQVVKTTEAQVGEIKSYLVVNQEGTYSAHRFYAGITHISLVPGTAALGYKAAYRADSVLNEMVTGYGYTMWANNNTPRTYFKDGKIADQELTLRVRNILVEGNDALNAIGATANIGGKAVIRFQVDGTELILEGTDHNTTLQEAVESVNSALGADRTAYTAEKVQAVRALLEKFSSYTNAWEQEYIFTEDKFAAVENVSATYGETLTLGHVFTAIEGVTIGENVTATVNGEVITVNTNWADTALYLNAGEADITITDNDRCWTATNTVVIGKANPIYTAPTDLTATYGDTLADVKLPAGFAWESTGSVGNAGTNTFTVSYTPDDTANYNVVSGIEVTVAVAKADSTCTAPTANDWTYNGQTQALVNAGTANGGTMVYSLTEGGEYTEAIPTATDAGKYTVYYKVVGDANHNDSAVASVPVEVAKADATCTAPTANELTYTGEAQALVTAGTATGGKLVYKLDDGEYSDTIPTAINAGTYTVYYKVEATDNYNGIAEQSITVTIAEANSVITKAPVAVEDLTYTGNAQALVTAGTATGGKLVYKLDDGEYSETIPTAINAGTYTVYYKVEATDNYNGIAEQSITVTIAEAVSADKFAQKMPAAEFTYRLGNANTVALGSLFAAKDGAEIDSATVNVTVSAVDGAVVSGAYTANTSDWTKGTLQFTGTGVVNVTIKDGTSNEFTLTFEIVNAKNATSAASATANNVVLLNDCGFSTIEVSNGYTLFGNGFTMTATSEPYANGFGDSFLALNNGTLDNVRIVVPFFANSFLYQSQAYSKSAVAGPYDGTYYNFRSAVYMTGNSKILNSYISGGRAAVYAPSGNPVLENTTIYGGATANIQIGSSAKTVTLRDMTLIQKPIEGTVNGSNAATVMGFSVIFTCATDGSTPPELTLEGYLDQFAWANDDYADYVPEGADSIITIVKKQTQYLHNISVDGVANTEWLNLGIVYWPMDSTGTVGTPTIKDNRTNQTEIPYQYTALSTLGVTGHVYSIPNTNAKDVTTPTEPAIENNSVTAPMMVLDVSRDGITTETAYDSTYGWMSSMTVDLDATGDYTFDFANLVASKYGKSLSYTVTDASGNAVGTTVALTDSGVHEYTLTILDDVDCNLDGGSTTHTYCFVLTATKTSIAGPVKVTDPSGDALLVVKSKDDDWSIAVPALEGAQIKYYNKTNKAYETLSLSTLTPTTKGKQNGTNNYWEYSDPNGNYTLKVTSGYIHEGQQVYGMPVVADNGGYKLYFTISNTNGYVSTNTTSRAVTISYVFTDSNGQSVSFSKAWSCVRADMINAGSKQYAYSDFCNGTLTEATSCVTPETLVTLADGSQVRVDSLTGNEQLLVWNMETGKLDSAPIMFVDSEAEAEFEIVHLYFSDGTDVKVISEHGFWDYDLNRYVYLDKDAAQYIGHTFAKQNGSELAKVQLTDVVIETEITTAWSPVTAGHLCYFVNGMLSMPGGVGGLFNIFEVDAETMTYDWDAMARDIETYGLFTYEELNDIVPLPYEMFEAAGGAYLKVSIGKGNLTMDELIAMIQRYTVKFQ